MKKIGFWEEKNKITKNYNKNFLYYKEEESVKPKIMQVRIIRNSILDENVGNSTKIEPSVNPIIPTNVILWNLSKRNLVIFIKTKQPKTNPIPIGINMLKDSVEIPVK